MSAPRILLVDDNRDLADGLAMFLEDEDYKVTVAYTGEAAVSESKRHAYDVVLMDFKLPGINGLEASLEIHKVRPEAQALIMTGFRLEQLLFEVARPGAVHTLYAPVSEGRLLGALEVVGPEGLVVVVGDGSRVAENVGEMLRAASRRIALARSPEQAAEMKRHSDVDVLLLDLGLPLTRSLEALFESGGVGGASVTFIVAEAPPPEAPTADVFRSRAVTGCFFKPFELDELLEVVGDFCGVPGDAPARAAAR